MELCASAIVLHVCTYTHTCPQRKSPVPGCGDERERGGEGGRGENIMLRNQGIMLLFDAHSLLQLCSTKHFIILKNYAIMLVSNSAVSRDNRLSGSALPVLVLLELSDASCPQSSTSLEIVVTGETAIRC